MDMNVPGEDFLITTENVVTTEVLTKLRRIKIQESIITASLEKSDFDQDDYTTVDSKHNADWKFYSAKLRNNINEIRNLFEDIKISTNDSEDNLKHINIEEIKKDILNLNGKIKALEDFLNTELTSLKSEEKELMRQMNEEPKVNVNTKGKLKTYQKQYNEVVPSPVRVLINSPLKCTEVQQFQAFMIKSKNRYGGWNEYNHNIFFQIWNKFYATDDIRSLENNMKEISRNNLLSQFKEEVNEKIPGIRLNDIISHSKWFSEFCYLKKAQQAALDKWRDNRRKIKGRQEKIKISKDISQNSNNKNLYRKQSDTYKNNKMISNGFLEDDEFERNQSLSKSNNTASEYSLQMNEELLFSTGQKEPHEQLIPKLRSTTFSTPTEQWINRCNDNGARKAFPYTNSNIEKVDKLCIPNWRLSLYENERIKKGE